MNKFISVGRLTHDPETRTFGSGGKVVNIRFVTDGGRKKDQTTGVWEEVPMYIDLKAFGQVADFVEAHVKKGSLVEVDARLELETWEDKTTNLKRSKHVGVLNSLTFANYGGPRKDNAAEGAEGAPAGKKPRAPKKSAAAPAEAPAEAPTPAEAGAAEDVPF